jgi:hypothetical protein
MFVIVVVWVLCCTCSFAVMFRFNELYHLPVHGRHRDEVHLQSLITLKNLYNSHNPNQHLSTVNLLRHASTKWILNSFIYLVDGNDNLQFVECDANDNCIESRDRDAITTYLKHQIKCMAMNLNHTPTQRTNYDIIVGRQEARRRPHELQSILDIELSKYQKRVKKLGTPIEIAQDLVSRAPHPTRFLFFAAGNYYEIGNMRMCGRILLQRLQDMMHNAKKKAMKKGGKFTVKSISKNRSPIIENNQMDDDEKIEKDLGTDGLNSHDNRGVVFDDIYRA